LLFGIAGWQFISSNSTRGQFTVALCRGTFSVIILLILLKVHREREKRSSKYGYSHGEKEFSNKNYRFVVVI